MSGYILLLAAAAFSAGFMLYLSNRKPVSTKGASTEIAVDPNADNAAQTGTKYPAVSVHVAPTCCQEALKLKGKRHLATEAPRLPLDDCAVAKCHCTYIHHADRRTGTFDRRRLLGLHKDYLLFFGNEDQREGRGRRASDWASAYEIHTP